MAMTPRELVNSLRYENNVVEQIDKDIIKRIAASSFTDGEYMKVRDDYYGKVGHLKGRFGEHYKELLAYITNLEKWATNAGPAASDGAGPVRLTLEDICTGLDYSS